MHEIRREKQYQKRLLAVSEVLSKIGISFISNFLLKARVLFLKIFLTEKFKLNFES